MNRFQAALFHARPIVEHGPGHDNYICTALVCVRREHPNLAGAVEDIRRHIERELDNSSTLWSWCLWHHRQKLTNHQLTLARLAWIDKLMERFA